LALGEPAYRARQVAAHCFGRLVDDPADWTDLPQALRLPLAEALTPTLLTPLRHQEADAGLTRKTLWRLFDAAQVESVLMRYPKRHSPDGLAELGEEADDGSESQIGRSTVCVSSQAGCGMACPFCATGQAGLTRNLSAGEIVEQVLAAARAVQRGELPGGPGRLSNVVFMGMGEPLANYRPLLQAIRTLTAPTPRGVGLSARGITVSTVGLVPAIDRLADEGLPLRLAVSLHAPDDEARDELVPVNTRWPVAEVIDAAHRYFRRSGRRVSIEYALIREVNDQRWRAELLARLLNRRGSGWAHVNPIPLNPTPGSRWTASEAAVQDAFVGALRGAGIATTVRDTRGREIDGACGQLAAQG
jgi:23S rRNA (adenine2503-C2)-methyltransferase